MHVGYYFTQGGLFEIPDSQLLLDAYSTYDVAKNHNLVENTREFNEDNWLIAYTNGRVQVYNHITNLKLLPVEVHFKSDLMANACVSMKTVVEIEGA